MTASVSKIRDFIHNFTAPKNSANFIGAPSFRYKNPYILDCFDEDRYASIYPSVKAIAGEFMKIRPFAIDANGKPRQNVPAVNALYHPNQLDSSVAFFEKLAVMNLTHRNTYVLVWRREGNEAKPGGELRPNNIAGFTFLENPGVERRDGKTFYNMGAQEFSDREVMTIPGGVDPSGLYTGYAPGVASRRWATLDEYIADFQKGFFENGAVPAGQFIITAATPQDFKDTVDRLQEAHRGAGKNNNVTYTPRPVDPTDGKPSQAKIEWIPFQQSNKEIDFKSLFEQANNRIDSTFGVPASIRGVGENNNYATARTDQQNFIRFTIEPLALRIYTQITHELNRITGGLGVAITFDIELPAIADEEKVQAETKSIEVAALRQLLDEGYSLDTAVDALDLSPRYKLLQVGDAPAVIENDKADVDEGDEVDDSPDPSKIDGVTPLNEAAKRTNPKAELSDFDKLEAYAITFMRSQIARAADDIADEEVENQTTGSYDEEELLRFVDDVLTVVTGMALAEGTIQLERGIELLVAANIAFEAISEFVLTDDQLTAYRSYLMQVGQSYGYDTQKAIQAILDQSNIEGWTAQQIKGRLNEIPDLQGYRATRIARTETVKAEANGSLYSMEHIQNETGVTINKVWNTSRSDSCEYCQAMNGTVVSITQPFISVGESIDGVDGGVLVNDFVDMDVAQGHPNCSCYLTYEVVR